MKKIVAVVLALVMVLGLSTVAFAAKSTSYQGLYAKTAADSEEGVVTLTVTAGKAVKYDKTTGLIAAGGDGVVEYATIGDGYTYVLADSLSDLVNPADIVLYKDAAYKVPVFYLQLVANEYYYDGVAFTTFGDDCGEVDYVDYDATKAYYTVKGDASVKTGIYEADVTGTLRLKVGADYVMVDATPVAYVQDAEAHTPVFEIKNGKTLSIECGVCGLKAVEAANVLSLPKKADVVAGTTTWYWPAAAVEAPAADATVESAQTFDAGIAMYVGMSVMAAAGSAVVLKKKD